MNVSRKARAIAASLLAAGATKMNVRTKARALAASLMIIAGLCGHANAQYSVNEINTRGVPVIRGTIPTHVPGSSHNVYAGGEDATKVYPTPVEVVVPATAVYVQPDDLTARLEATWNEGQYGRNVGPAPAVHVASPARQRELLAAVHGNDRQEFQGHTLPAPGTARQIKAARHAQIAARMAYNDRVKTRSEMELDYIQANMWWYMVNTPAASPWQLLMDSATMYGYHGYGYGTQNRLYPVYGLGGPGCVPQGGY